MTTDQMKTFIKASEYLNFTKAAEQLYITQSAISRQISAMEQELSCQLFVRQNSQLRLTSEGRLLYQGLSRIYNDYMILLHALADYSSGMSGELCIGILDDQTLDPWFGEIFSSFTKARPNVRITFQRLDVQSIDLALRNGRIDIAVTLFRGKDSLENANYYVYAMEQMYLAVPRRLLPPGIDPDADEAFEQLLTSLPMAMIAPENFGNPLTSFAWDVLNNKIIRTEIRFEPTMGSLTNLVTSGLYCTVANETNILSLYPEIIFVKARRFGKIRKGIKWMPYNENPLLSQLVAMIRNFSSDKDDRKDV